MTLHGLTILFEMGAATMAVPAARTRLEYRPIAAFLVGTMIANAARLAIISYVLTPARDTMRAAGIDPAVVPFTGWAEVAIDVEHALFLLWPAGIAALSMAVFLRRRPWAVAVVWALASIALTVGYPALRGAALARWYTAAELASLLVGVGCFASWLPHRRERPAGLHTTIVTLLVAVGLAGLVVGPWRFGIFDKWASAQIIYAITYAVIFVLEGGFFMDEAEIVAAIATVVAMTLALHVLLLFELRWQGRLLEELKVALLKQGGGAHPELTPANRRATAEIEAEIIEDSKAEWDRRLAERAGDEAPPTQPSARSPPPRTPRT